MNNSYFKKNLYYVIFLTFVLCFTVIAQENDQSGKSEWTTIETEGGELKVGLPADYLVNAENDGTRKYVVYGHQNGVSMILSVYKKKRQSIVQGYVFSVTQSQTSSTSVLKNGMTVFSTVEKKYDYRHRLIITSDDYQYVLSVVAPDENVPELKRFLYSIKIKNDPLFNSDEKNSSAAVVSGDLLKTSPKVSAALEQKTEKKKERKVVYEFILGRFELPREKSLPNMKPAIIVEKEIPTYRPKINRFSNSVIKMEVSVEVELLADGQVGDIHVYSNGSGKEYAKACLKSAEKLKFIPAEVEGKPVDSKQIVEFNMTLITSTAQPER